MVVYGLPYQGSKSRVAEWMVGVLPAADTLVDLFAGGCAVTHAALLSGKWRRVVANDIGEGPQVFLDAVRGEYEGFASVASRDGFEGSDDFMVRLLYSFGSDRCSYAYSPCLEAVKVPAERMLVAPSVHERRVEYRRFVRALEGYLRGVAGGEGAGCLDRLLSLDGVQRLERVNALEGLRGVVSGLSVSCLDYRDVRVPDGAVVYADPPYRRCANSRRHTGVVFDWEAFDGWLAGVGFPVFVSEFDAPAGCVEVACRERVSSMSATSTGRVVERLFVQERFRDVVCG